MHNPFIRYAAWRPVLRVMLFVIFLGLIATTASAGGINALIMPGELTASHAELEQQCHKCHASPSQAVTNTNCRSCHKDVAADIDHATGFHGHLADARERQCKSCHVDHRGRKSDIMALDRKTVVHDHFDFVLKGAHLSLDCQACHAPGKKFREAPHECATCHKDDEPHQGRLGTACTDCHDESGWKKTGFYHSRTSFPLQGGHARVECSSCHANRQFKETPTACVACHKINDVHAGRFGQKCDACHLPERWQAPKFDHARDTRFRLVGSHRQVTCESCHAANPFEQKPAMACVSCHKKQDEHQGRNGDKCESCHTPQAWTKTTFDHARTRFPLRGSHANVACESCHKAGVHDEKPGMACVGCHKKTDPHRNQEGERCEQCHNEQGWRLGVAFNHDLSRFPLVGLHAVAPCTACHLTPSFQDAETECHACHRETDPHKQALGTDCKRCHTPNGWRIWNFDHTQTGFALTGRHEKLTCSACHTQPAEANQISLSRECVSCHQKHDAHHGSYGQDCSRCHEPTGFRPPKSPLRE